MAAIFRQKCPPVFWAGLVQQPLGVDLAVNMAEILLIWATEVTMVKEVLLWRNSARQLK